VTDERALSLRPARAEDLDAIADLFLACWRTSYRGVLPTQVVEIYGPDQARSLWRRSLVDAADERQVVVAERSGGEVLGVITTGRDPEHREWGHIFSLYVHPRAQGRGVGSRLIALAIERFREAGLSTASLWVFEANAGARAVYEHLGWLPDGARRFEPGYGEPEIRLTCSV
jgi:ribosomal protein S18 acetylase RimI-like enzyme